MKQLQAILTRCAVAVLAGASSATAGTITWDGGPSGAGTNWNEAVNWSGDIKPGATDGARLSAAGTSSGKVITLGASQFMDILSLDGFSYDLTVGTAADAAAGSSLTLNHVYRSSNMGGVHTLATDIALATNSVWDIAAGYNNGVTVLRAIRGPGMTLEKNNTGTLILGGTNTYSGTTIVRQGTLELGFGQSAAPLTNILSSAATLSVINGSVTLRGKAGSLNSQTVNGLAVNPGSTTFNIVDANSANKTRMAFGGITRTTGGTVNFVQPTGNTTVSADNGYVTTNANDASGILGAYATVGSANWAANDGANIVAYSGYTTLVGSSTNLSDSATSNVRISNASTGTVGLASAAVSVNTLLCSDAAARTLAIGPGGTLRLGATGGILTPSGTGALTIDGGTLTAGGADNTAGEMIFQNATAVTNSAVIADNGNGAVALTKTGAGSLVLTAAPTHTGGTVLNAGSLFLPGGANPLFTNGALTVNGGLLNLGGGVLTNTASVSFRGGTTTNGSIAKFGANFDAQGGLVTVPLGGSAGLDKTTSSTLSLIGPNTYAGTTTVREGTIVGGLVATGRNGDIAINGNLIVGSPEGGLPAVYKNASSSSAPYNSKAFNAAKNVTVYANGTVDFASGDQYMNAGATLTIIGGYFTGSQFYNSATVYMTGGTFAGSLYGNNFNFNSFATSSTAYVTAYLRNSHTFTVADGPAAIDLLYTGGHDSAGKTLTKAGAGVMALGVVGRSYTGPTAVNGGTLLVNNTNFVSGTGNSAVSVNAGATLGGIGFIGGVANFSNANVTVTGSAAGAVTNRATVAPGSIDAVTGAHVIGTLTVGNLAVQTNNVTFGAYSTLKVNIATNGTCDKLVVNGTLSLATASDKLELTVADASALKPGTYTLATFQQLAAPGQVFETVTGLPQRGNLVYTATSIGFVINPKGTAVLIN